MAVWSLSMKDIVIDMRYAHHIFVAHYLFWYCCRQNYRYMLNLQFITKDKVPGT